MASENLKLELLRFLKEEGALQFVVEAWAVAWYNATLFPEERVLPCPACFLKAEVRALRPLAASGKIGAVRCEHCRMRFEFQDD